MKQNIGELSEADLKARLAFGTSEVFSASLLKKAIERSSMKMQKLVKAMHGRSAEEIIRIKSKPCYLRRGLNAADMMIATASESDFNHAISTFKIL